jgi:hypothetical protein
MREERADKHGSELSYRRPIPADFRQIFDLQNKNLASVLTPEERSDGFLSVAFSVENFQEMDRELGVIVGVNGERVCSYVCLTSIEYAKRTPLLATMIECFSNVTYCNKTLSEYNSCVIGPGCISKEYRGTGATLGLISSAKKLVANTAPGTELLASFISVENQRSVHGSQKVGNIIVGEFKFKEKGYFITVFPMVPRSGQ